MLTFAGHEMGNRGKPRFAKKLYNAGSRPESTDSTNAVTEISISGYKADTKRNPGGQP
jgi:hypothetical protein